MLAAKGGEQRSDIALHAAMHMGMDLAQQGLHGYPLVKEEADVALRRGRREDTFQGGEGRMPVILSGESQRPQDEDFQGTVHARFGFSIRKEAIQQVQGLQEQRACRIVPPLGDAYPCQGQVFPLTGIG